MIFKEVEVPKQPILFDQGNKKKKAEGYEEREETQFKSFKVSEFVTGGNFLEILSLASEVYHLSITIGLQKVHVLYK
jgi:hypothetical protein